MKFVVRAFLLIGLVTLGITPRAQGLPPHPQDTVTSALQISQIVELTKYISSPSGSNDTYPELARVFFPFASGGSDKKAGLAAFEENPSFIYALGGRAGFRRRVVVLRPSIVIVDDEIGSAGEQSAERWRIDLRNRPVVKGLSAQATVSDMTVSWETLSPQQGTYRLQAASDGNGQSAPYSLELFPSENSRPERILTVFSVRPSNSSLSLIRSVLTRAADQFELTISTAREAYHLELPTPGEGAGEIMASGPDGKSLIDERPLPGGVLPHGPEGSRLLQLWDSDYRGQHPPIWDLGHPADELKRVIDSGKIRSCRALDLCCGSGNDAIYLAGQKFDVTAIDVAPTAIAQAQQKAKQAGVSVHWIVADVLAPPNLAPFDFIYDRGCYHVVRDQNLAAYMDMLQRFSHLGTQFLLLASQRGAHSAEDGSTGVTEDELNFDFLPLFNIEWLRSYQLETSHPGVPGPPAWSVLLNRKAQP